MNRSNRHTRIGGLRPGWIDVPGVEETIHARGHPNVSAEHTSTFEVTTDDYLTPAGDCILGIEADCSPADFDPAFVSACRRSGVEMAATIRASGYEQVVTGRGDPDLTFESDRSAVVRTSDYVDDRTVMVGAGASAADLDRDLVSALASGERVELELRVSPA